MLTLGHQTQVALVAPTEAKMSCTWRQAATNWPGLLPLARSPHGNQLPFISQSKRRKNGWPQSRAFEAKFAMYESYLPLMTSESWKSGCVDPPAPSDPQERNGIAPYWRRFSIGVSGNRYGAQDEPVQTENGAVNPTVERPLPATC